MPPVQMLAQGRDERQAPGPAGNRPREPDSPAVARATGSSPTPRRHRAARLTRINPPTAPKFHHARDVLRIDRASSVNITGIVVYAKPDRCGAVREALLAIGGVEVHAISPEGRMVVTVERANDGAATDALDAIAATEGVLSTALVYHHDETLTEESTSR